MLPKLLPITSLLYNFPNVLIFSYLAAFARERPSLNTFDVDDGWRE